MPSVDEWPNLWDLPTPVPILDTLATPTIDVLDHTITLSYAPHPYASAWHAVVRDGTLEISCRGMRQDTVYSAYFSPRRFGPEQGTFSSVTLKEHADGVVVTVSKT